MQMLLLAALLAQMAAAHLDLPTSLDEYQILSSGGLFDHDHPSAITGGFSRMRKAKLLEQRKALHRRSRKRSQVYMAASAPGACFPASNMTAFEDHLPPLNNWWCAQEEEYGFLGFTYDISRCPMQAQLAEDFARMKTDYDARYVRITGVCDEEPTYHAIVDAAWNAGLGVYASLWLGFGDDNKWPARIAELVSVARSHPKASYVIRNIAVGSDPLYDGLFSPTELSTEIESFKAILRPHHIQVSVSEMPYGLQEHKGAAQVLGSADVIGLHVSPFFSKSATEGDQAWPFIQKALAYTQSKMPAPKPIRITQTGWPSDDAIFRSRSLLAAADLFNQQGYFELLDAQCPEFKAQRIGWFAHTWSDAMTAGWGLMNGDGAPKYDFAARSSC